MGVGHDHKRKTIASGTTGSIRCTAQYTCIDGRLGRKTDNNRSNSPLDVCGEVPLSRTHLRLQCWSKLRRKQGLEGGTEAMIKTAQ